MISRANSGLFCSEVFTYNRAYAEKWNTDNTDVADADKNGFSIQCE